METLKDVYLSKKQFEKDLDDCLTIINYPSRTRKYYVCEHISPALLRRKVKVFVNKQIMSKEKTKVLNLSLTEKEIESLEKISKEFFGTPNKSGMVRYWITQALKDARTQCCC